jgi:hypothetical protein
MKATMTRAARDKPRGLRADIFKRTFEPEIVRRFAFQNTVELWLSVSVVNV